MTRDEILEMEPGNQLNVNVAMQVFGWQVIPFPIEAAGEVMNPFECRAKLCPPGEPWGDYPLPDFSGDVAAAWTVREELRESGGVELIRMCEDHPECCIFTTVGFPLSMDHHQVIGVMADTMMEAVCKVSLLAELEGLEPFDVQGERCDAWLRIEEVRKP
jgi:hypothetical protein